MSAWQVKAKEKEKEKEESFLNILSRHLENSSAHGLPNIKRASRPLTKFLWLMLFLGGIGIITWQVAIHFNEYFDFNYVVSLEIKFDKSQTFPAVTICNMNPLMRTKLEQADDSFRKHFDVNFAPPSQPLPNGQEQQSQQQGQQQQATPAPEGPLGPGGADASATSASSTVGSQGDVGTSQTTIIGSTTEAIESWEDREKGLNFFQKQSEDFLRQRRLITKLANKTAEERHALGHSLEDMLLECSWKGFPCSPANFTTMFDTRFGNCYSFNSGKDREVLTTNRPGPHYGLSLQLFVQQDEYMEEFTEVAGIRVIIHHPHRMPFPRDEGIFVSPGQVTGVGVRMLEIERLPDPYGECKEDVTKNLEKDMYHQNFKSFYSQQTCELTCYQRAVISDCGCSDPSFPIPLDGNDTTFPCDIDNEEEIECLDRIEREYHQGTVNCECLTVCHEITYLYSISSGIWPSDAYEKKLFEKMVRSNEEMRRQVKGQSPSEWTRKNIAKLEVYFQEFNYEYIRQDKAYSIPDLLSDIGGQLGLWLGLSVITVFEAFEGLCVIISFLFSGRRLNKRKKTPEERVPTRQQPRTRQPPPPPYELSSPMIYI